MILIAKFYSTGATCQFQKTETVPVVEYLILDLHEY